MSFYQILEKIPFNNLLSRIAKITPEEVERSILASKPGFFDFLAFISPSAQNKLEEMARVSHRLTAQRFGNVIQLYVPLYLSNKCQNTCLYCGFNKNNIIQRSTLTPKQTLLEADILRTEGFQHILLVSGESAEINIKYLEKFLPDLKSMFSSISIEIAPQSLEEYRILYSMGVEGITVYQETYKSVLYEKYHPTGKKNNFSQRLSTPEKAGQAGMRKIGIGSLLGLCDWRYEAIALYHHIQYLIKHFWKAQISLSFPRLQKFQGKFSSPFPVSDIELAQLICAMRLAFPDLVLVLSTRERQSLRDGLVKLGITQISAGSRTNPGGYSSLQESGEQFEIQDSRSPEEIADKLKELGYDPVWKDWEGFLSGYSSSC